MPSTSRSATTTSQSATARWLGIVAHVIRLILWPIRHLSQYIFPSTELDGLSTAVTAKAALQFVTYLQSIQDKRLKATAAATSSSADSSSSSPPSVSVVWQATGFAALRQEASQNQALLLVYLHSPWHRLADKLSEQVLCHDDMLRHLNDPNVLGLGVSVHTALGAHLQQILQVTALPCMAVMQPAASGSSSSSSNTLQLLFRAQGPALLKLLHLENSSSSTTTNHTEHLLPILRTALQKHQAVLAEHTARRLHREQEAELRRTQDEEYQQALEADRERERLAAEERERAAAEQAAKEEAARQEQQAQEEALAKAMSLVRPEPATGGAQVRLVLPSGVKVNRRFHADDTIGTVKAFLFLHFQENSLPIRNIGLSTNFPKTTYTDDAQTLQEAQLVPQAVLMVQDLDA